MDKVIFSSKNNNWETPQGLFNKLNGEFNFVWDLAANKSNAKCEHYFSLLDNALDHDWSNLKGNLFLNPPYGRDIKYWVMKAAKTKLDKDQKLVLLIPARTDTSYWHDYIFNQAEIRFIRGRIKFEQGGEQIGAAPFPSAIVVYKGE